MKKSHEKCNPLVMIPNIWWPNWHRRRFRSECRGGHCVFYYNALRFLLWRYCVGNRIKGHPFLLSARWRSLSPKGPVVREPAGQKITLVVQHKRRLFKQSFLRLWTWWKNRKFGELRALPKYDNAPTPPNAKWHHLRLCVHIIGY